MSKEIRILSGTHAGARLQMAAGIWKIGCDDSMDVQLSDWTQAPVSMEIGKDGSVTWIATDTDGPGTPLMDLHPIRMGDIIICVGDAVGTWPDDADLLEKLNAPTVTKKNGVASRPLTAKQPLRWLMVGSAALIGVAVSTAILPGQTSQATVLPNNTTLLKKVQNVLANSHQTELNASLEGDRIIVHGLVHSNADAIAVKEMLHKIVPSNSLIDISNIADVIANIHDSVHDAGVKVGYEGNGNFNVTGAVRSVAAMQKTLTQLEADFGPSIKISLNVTPAAQKWDVTDSESALVSGTLQYVQAIDGSKHFPPSRY